MLLHWIRGDCAGALAWQPDSHGYTNSNPYCDGYSDPNPSHPDSDCFEYIHRDFYSYSYAFSQHNCSCHVHTLPDINIYTDPILHSIVDSQFDNHALLHTGCRHSYTFIHSLPIGNSLSLI